ncbi:MAG: hypothetical protein U9O83_01220 [Campylobacterota bacterium]|nr:hypothetical protein [Campylobacterota bacterium]
MIKLDKLPQDIRLKLNKNVEKIQTLNSAELLNYSKDLHQLKDDIDTNTRNFLFEVIGKRTEYLNQGIRQEAECKLTRAVKKFKKDNR